MTKQMIDQNKNTIYQLFSDRVKKSASNIAVVYDGEAITYAELFDRINRLAQEIQILDEKKRMQGQDFFIGLSLSRGIEMITGMLAIIAVGGTYVPLDPLYPKERLAYIVDDAKISIVLTDKKLIPKWKTIKNDLHYVCINGNKHYQGDAQPIFNDTANVDNLAYVIYTSGSTGRPKGVMVKQRGVINLACAQRKILDLNEKSHVLQYSSINFDASVWEIFSTLFFGASLYIVPEKIRPDYRKLCTFINKNKISIAVLPPAILSLFPNNNLRSLQTLVVAGDVCNEVIMKKWGKHRKLINAYGPTEVTVCATYAIYEGVCKYNNIGYPIANVSRYVLGHNLKKVSKGSVGELFIGGVGLARGYLNQPELTKEKFIENPFLSDQERADKKALGEDTRIYKTGDLVRLVSDESIEFIGRIDNQVKIRGFRIEPEEVGYLLNKHPGINKCIVIAKEVKDKSQQDQISQKRLIAYYVVNKNTNLNKVTSNVLRKYLEQNLPEYMIPSYFISLKQMPLTLNGKIDKENLPLPGGDNLNLDNKYVSPHTHEEKILTKIWRNVLKLDIVGINDNFFSLGGDSLNAATVAIKINDVFGLGVSLETLFKYPTIFEFAKYINKSFQLKSKQPCIGLKKQPRGKFIPLSYSQEQIWFHQQLLGDNCVYIENFSINFNEMMNIKCLEKAINYLVRRHEALRFRLVKHNEQILQRFEDYKKFKLHVINLPKNSKGLVAAETVEYITSVIKKPFDLFHESPIRFILAKLTSNFCKLYVVVHHMALDGISLYKIFLPELEKAYRAFLENKTPCFDKVIFQYGDYANWQRNLIRNTAIVTGQLSYWKTQLADLEGLNLFVSPTDSKSMLWFGARECLKISPELSLQLKNFSKAESCTLFIVLMAVFVILLFRYSGQNDIAFGTVFHGRNQELLSKIFGNFLNTIIIRCRFVNSITFSELLVLVKKVLLEAQKNQDIPYQIVSKNISVKNGMNNQMFNTAFIFEPALEDDKSKWELSQLEMHNDTTKFDLTFELDERSYGIIGRVEYNKNIFSKSSILRMIDHYQILLENIVKSPLTPISSINLLTKEEKQFLTKFNQTNAYYQKDKTIHELFEEQARKNPNHIALIFENQELTYKELNERANQLALYIRAHYENAKPQNHRKLRQKFIPDTLIALCLNRSFDMLVSILGVLKAGGAYVPIDPSYPEERIKFILRDTNTEMVITQEHFGKKLEAITKAYKDRNTKIIFIDNDQTKKKLLQLSVSDLKPISKAKDLAYVIYTSGTTGKPKGSMLNHSGIVNRIQWMQGRYPLTPVDRVLQKTPYVFDVSVWELLWANWYGATIVLAKPDGHKDNQYLHELITKQKITVLHFVPSMFNAYLDYIASSELFKAPSVKQLFCSGEALPSSQVLKFEQLKSNGQLAEKTRLSNLYGPTEASIDVTYYDCDKQQNLIPIGKPIANIQVYVLDTDFNQVPIDLIGELYIGGVGLARGYLNQTELTQQKFIENPFLSRQERAHKKLIGEDTRIYKTGDLGRWRADGNIEFIGRIDNQVKIRGFRIELSEIESLLCKYPGITQCIVIASDIGIQKQLIAYYVTKKTKKDTEITVNLLRHYLERDLPEYMIPSYFVALEKIPLTINGKVDKTALPLPNSSNLKLANEYVAPRTTSEKILAKIWRDVLKLDRVGIYDNFFNLGGDSIMSIQVVSRAREAGLYLAPKQLLVNTTIAELAKESLENKSGLDDIVAEQGLASGEFNFTPIQQWFFEKNFINPNYFNQAFLFKCKLQIDKNILIKVFTKLMEHHDVLRLRFSNFKQKYVNSKTTATPLIKEIDLSKVKDQASFIEKSNAKLQAGLDIEHGPVMILGLYYNHVDGRQRLFIAIHHLIIDWVSWKIFLEDIESAYQQLLSNQKISLPAKTSSYKTWSEVLQSYAKSELLRSELDYWLSIEKEVSNLPVDRVSETTQVKCAGLYTIRLTQTETKQLLTEVPKAYQTHINDILLSALALAVFAWTGQKNLFLNLEGHGREGSILNVDVYRTIGWFTSIYPVHLYLPDEVDNMGNYLAMTIKAIKEQLRKIPNKGIGYGVLKYLANDNLSKQFKKNDRASISFNYLGGMDDDSLTILQKTPESVGSYVSLDNQMTSLIDANAMVMNDHLYVNFCFSSRHYYPATIKNFGNGFKKYLRLLINHCTQPDAVGYTPSDFKAIQLNQKEIDNILDSDSKNLETLAGNIIEEF
ncbi:MAG: amino acid adenylation domain-containing protein [Gammaproteobacteria bacterium]|nr:amino acid adenylation domain-containing protein [Gammaproteobacteria bacterium]